MPKVLRIINRFNLGGPTYNAAYLTKYLSPEFETLLIGGHKDETEEKSDFIVRNLGIEPVTIPEMRREISLIRDLKAYYILKKIIRDFKPDIVHTHASKAGTLGRIAAYYCKVPIIVHTFHGHVFHSYFNTYKASLFQKIERRLARFSSQIIAISDLQKDELANRFKITDSNKITVIPLGFDLNKFQQDTIKKRKQFRSDFNIDDDEIAIAIVGRLVPIKNHNLFVEAIGEIKNKTTKKIRAFIIGDGESRPQIEDFTRKLNIDFVDSNNSRDKATITFTSWIKNIDYAYAGIDIVALTSLNEGTPVSLIEAQASNKPIVSTNAGGIENTVIPDVTALLSEIGNKQEFTDNLFKLIEDDKLRNKLSQHGWDFVKEKYHYTRLASEMSVLYNKLLNEKKS